MRSANGIRECEGRSVVNCVPEFGRSFISYISGGFRASWPGSDNQLLDRDLRKADLHPSTGPCPLTTRFDSGHFLIRRSDLEGAVLCDVDELGSNSIVGRFCDECVSTWHCPRGRRSEARRVGTECVSPCSTRWSKSS